MKITAYASSFNPRTLTGCDTWYLIPSRPHPRFNPRTLTGCDQDTTAVAPNSTAFQSTHPHGVRPGTYENYSLCVKFQSTHPHGVRHLVLDTVKTASSFQSTHPHGVRPGHDRRRAKLDGVSIHAPSRGATFVIHIFAVRSCFNPRTLTGCDLLSYLTIEKI